MKEYKKKVKSIFELPHIFAHKLGNTSRGRFKIVGNKFYRDNKLMSIIIGRSVFILNVEADNFHNSIAGWDIVNAFRDSKTKIYVVNEISESLQKNVESYVKGLVLNNLRNIDYFLQVVENPRKQANSWSGNALFLDSSQDYLLIREKYSGRVDFSFIDEIIGSHWFDNYNGWRRFNSFINIDKTYKQVLTGHFLNSKEKEIYNAKRFWYNYIKSNNYFYLQGIKSNTIEDKINIYRNKELRNKIISFYNKEMTRKLLLKERKIDNEINNYLIELDKWMNNNSNLLIRSSWYISDYVSQGIKLINNEVLTSDNVRVPISHAKLLYKVFINCEKEDKEFNSNGHTIKIGLYKVSSIKKIRINKKEQYTIIAGCHKISSDVIHKFIKINNLDW